MKLIIGLFINLVLISSCVVHAWDNDELEIFDAVELINENFYKLLNVKNVSLKNKNRLEQLIIEIF